MARRMFDRGLFVSELGVVAVVNGWRHGCTFKGYQRACRWSCCACCEWICISMHGQVTHLAMPFCLAPLSARRMHLASGGHRS